MNKTLSGGLKKHWGFLKKIKYCGWGKIKHFRGVYKNKTLWGGNGNSASSHHPADDYIPLTAQPVTFYFLLAF